MVHPSFHHPLIVGGAGYNNTVANKWTPISARVSPPFFKQQQHTLRSHCIVKIHTSCGHPLRPLTARMNRTTGDASPGLRSLFLGQLFGHLGPSRKSVVWKSNCQPPGTRHNQTVGGCWVQFSAKSAPLRPRCSFQALPQKVLKSVQGNRSILSHTLPSGSTPMACHVAVGQNRFGIPFWGRCTTHFGLF